MNTTVNELGALIQSLRESAGLSVQELAEKMRVRERYIAMWEQGVHIPTVESVKRLAEILPLPVAELEGPLRAYHEKQRQLRQIQARSAALVREAAPKKSLSPQEEIKALAWAAHERGVNYGQFIAQTAPEDYPLIYGRYLRHINAQRAVKRARGRTRASAISWQKPGD